MYTLDTFLAPNEAGATMQMYPPLDLVDLGPPPRERGQHFGGMDQTWDRIIRNQTRRKARDNNTQSRIRERNLPGTENKKRIGLTHNTGAGLVKAKEHEVPSPKQYASDSFHDVSTSLQTPDRRRPKRKRFVLPLLLAHSSGTFTTVMACPDSGSDDNIMSLELVVNLGLKMEQASSGESRQFSIANGKIITALGQVSTSCSFTTDSLPEFSKLECTFYVFHTLAVPLIMGVDFLQETETLSKHKDRLVEQSIPAMQSLRVNSIGRPKRSLICRLGAYVGCATVDTGSDLDFVSSAFAKSRAYKIEPAFEQVEFADCSVGYTSGVMKVPFVVGNMSDVGFHARGEPLKLDLFVLDNLNADILVGQDTIEELDIFNLHNESLIPSIPQIRESDINIIRHIGSIEQGAAMLWKKMKSKLGNSTSDNRAGVASQVDMDQRENARREQERARIANLSGSDKERAQELENAAIQAFEKQKEIRLSVLGEAILLPRRVCKKRGRNGIRNEG